jgi:hypothetical protein
MTAIAWMAGASVASWLAVSALGDDRVNPEALWGMLGPLVSACVAWISMVRAHRSAPERLTAVMMVGFALKLLFFGVYVAVMVRVVGLRLVPFVTVFTGYFIALYAMQALFLRRLMLTVPSTGRGHDQRS